MLTNDSHEEVRLALNNERLNLGSYFDTLNLEKYEYAKKRILSRKTTEKEWNLLLWIQADNQEKLLEKHGFFNEAKVFTQEKQKCC